MVEPGGWPKSYSFGYIAPDRDAHSVSRSPVIRNEDKAVTPQSAPDPEPTEAHTIDTNWTFMTNHAHVLLCLAQDPHLRLRDVAVKVGITERAVQRIVADLHDAGYIEVFKEGRRNRYEVRTGMHLRHPVERHRTVEELMQLILP